MKKLLVVLVSLLMVLSLSACGAKEEEAADANTIEKLVVSFVPSKDADVILEAANGQTEEQVKNGWRGLGQILIDGLAEKGFTVKEVEIGVGTDYAATGEGMIAGTIDLGLIPASTYTLYQPDGVNLLVEAQRWGVAGEDASVALDPKDGIAPWNGAITQNATSKATGYASLIYVNIASEKGADLYEKAQAGTLTWEDVDAATWYVCSSTSSAGYVYPSLWLNDNFGEGAGAEKKTIASLSNVIPDGSYANMMESLVTGGCDVTVGYADVRKDAASTTAWEAVRESYGADWANTTVWDAVKVIAVSDMIMNDTVSYADPSVDAKMTPELVKALQEVFIALGETEEGQAAVKPYSHMGYTLGQDSDYDATRAANKLFQ